MHGIANVFIFRLIFAAICGMLDRETGGGLMAKHEFGFMDRAPQSGERYDTYEPDRYHCISIDDSHIEGRLSDFEILPCYAHMVDIPCGGLCYCGITLIPPHTAGEMCRMVSHDYAFDELIPMLLRAEQEHKWIIHFGI